MTINYDYNDDHYKTLKQGQDKAVKNNNVFKEISFILIWSKVMVQ